MTSPARALAMLARLTRGERPPRAQGEIRRFVLVVLLALGTCAITPDVAASEPDSSQRTQKVSIGAAANLIFALEALNAEFARVRPATTLGVSIGASGGLFAQIKHGAPFDVFLSADSFYPEQLVAARLADASTLRTFAHGRLAFWTRHDALPLDDLAVTLRHPALEKLAIAQPKTAPYGRAAQIALEKLGVWRELQPKLVFGESIAQTMQFVDTGTADAGFVALAVVLSPRLEGKGRWVEVPPDLYAGAPLDHTAVLTGRGEQNPAARAYLDFLETVPAKKILRAFGYGVKH